jgi:hypothetical protein
LRDWVRPAIRGNNRFEYGAFVELGRHGQAICDLNVELTIGNSWVGAAGVMGRRDQRVGS